MNKPQTATLLTSDEVKTAINQRLEKFFTAKQRQAAKIDHQYEDLIGKMQDLIVRGGKRMRPYLAYLGYAGSGGQDSEKLLDAALALEVLHNFLLIHDDIMDRDFHRYGGLNIAGLYKRQFGEQFEDHQSEHLGSGLALLAGDINLSFVYDIITTSDFDATTRLELIKQVNQIIFIEGGGQQLDFLAPLRQMVEEADLFKIYEYKSGRYSIQMPLEFGVCCSGAKAIDFSDFARPVGISFQLADDLLGMYGDEAQTGKPVLSDLREGKRTVLMMHGLRQGSEAQKRILQQHLGNPAADMDDLEETRNVLNDIGARSYVQELCQKMVTEAKASLQQLPLQDEVKVTLGNLSDFIIKRNF